MATRNLRRFALVGGLGIVLSSILAGTATVTFDLSAAYSVAFLVPGIAVLLFGAYAYGINPDPDIVDPTAYATRLPREEFVDFAAVATASALAAVVLTALAIELDLLAVGIVTGELLAVETLVSMLVIGFGVFAGLYAGVVRLQNE